MTGSTVPSIDPRAVRALPALVASSLGAVALGAVALLVSCATPEVPTPVTRLVVRDDPYLLDPGASYPLAGVSELARRAEVAYGALRRGEELAEVETAGRDLLADDPGFHPATVLLAQVEYLRDEDDAALELLRPVVDELPGYQAAQMLLGRAAERSGDLPAAFEAFAQVAPEADSAIHNLAAGRARKLRPRAVETMFDRLRDAVSRGRLEDAVGYLAWLDAWDPGSREALEGTRLVAVERGDPETELAAVRRLAEQTGERQFRQREAELEVEIGDLRSGLEKLEALSREFPDDQQLVESFEQAEFLWRLRLLPPEVQDIGRKAEIDRADVSSLLYWLIPRVRYSQVTNPPIAADILDHPRREVILRVLSLGLMEIDETLHRFDPAAPARRVAVLKAQLALLDSSPQRLSCLGDPGALELDRSWSSLCGHAARCRLIPEAADCRPAASISGAEALELFRQTLNLLGSSG